MRGSPQHAFAAAVGLQKGGQFLDAHGGPPEPSPQGTPKEFAHSPRIVRPESAPYRGALVLAPPQPVVAHPRGTSNCRKRHASLTQVLRFTRNLLDTVA